MAVGDATTTSSSKPDRSRSVVAWMCDESVSRAGAPVVGEQGVEDLAVFGGDVAALLAACRAGPPQVQLDRGSQRYGEVEEAAAAAAGEQGPMELLVGLCPFVA